MIDYKRNKTEEQSRFFCIAGDIVEKTRQQSDMTDSVYWWRYATPNDPPPQEIKVGDKFVHRTLANVKVIIVFCKYQSNQLSMYYGITTLIGRRLVDDGEEALYAWTEQQLLKYYERVN